MPNIAGVGNKYVRTTQSVQSLTATLLEKTVSWLKQWKTFIQPKYSFFTAMQGAPE